MTQEMYGAEDVSIILGMSKPYAYKLIQRLNKEREQSGLIIIPGKISKSYFELRVLDAPRVSGGGAHVC